MIADQLSIGNDIAWLRATHPNPAFRDGPQALKMAEQLVQQSHAMIPEILDTLAAALADEKQFVGAEKVCERAISLATASAAAN